MSWKAVAFLKVLFSEHDCPEHLRALGSDWERFLMSNDNADTMPRPKGKWEKSSHQPVDVTFLCSTQTVAKWGS
jgi:hypothetical protein